MIDPVKAVQTTLISVTKRGEIAPYIRVADFLRRYYTNYLLLETQPLNLKIVVTDGTPIKMKLRRLSPIDDITKIITEYKVRSDVMELNGAVGGFYMVHY